MERVTMTPEQANPAERRCPAGLSHLTLRPLARGDEAALARFYASLSPATRAFFEPYTQTDEVALQEVVERALAGRDLSLVALDPQGEVLAHFFIWNLDWELSHLGIGLREEYQNFGLGRTLLTHLLNLGQHRLGKEQLGLTVVKQNVRAVRLYQRLGFQIVGEVTFRAPQDSYEMRICLR